METRNAIKIIGVLALFLLLFFGFLFYESQRTINKENLTPIKKTQNITPPTASSTPDLNKEAEIRTVTEEEWSSASEERINKAEEMLSGVEASTTQWIEQKSDRLKKLEALRSPQTQ